MGNLCFEGLGQASCPFCVLCCAGVHHAHVPDGSQTCSQRKFPGQDTKSDDSCTKSGRKTSYLPFLPKHIFAAPIFFKFSFYQNAHSQSACSSEAWGLVQAALKTCNRPTPVALPRRRRAGNKYAVARSSNRLLRSQSRLLPPPHNS